MIAEQARRLAESDDECLVDIVYTEIRDAAIMGEFNVTIDKRKLSEADANVLRSQGYRVYFNVDFLWWEISW